MLVGFDDDLTAESTRLTNRLPGMPAQVHPALGTKSRDRSDRPLRRPHRTTRSRPGTPAADRAKPICGAGELVDQLWAALQEQSVVVRGTVAAETVLP